MAAVAVVDAISRRLREIAFDLIEQTGETLAIAPIGGGDFNADEVLGGFVLRQVRRLPTPCGRTVPRLALHSQPAAAAGRSASRNPAFAHSPSPKIFRPVKSTTTCAVVLRPVRETLQNLPTGTGSAVLKP